MFKRGTHSFVVIFAKIGCLACVRQYRTNEEYFATFFESHTVRIYIYIYILHKYICIHFNISMSIYKQKCLYDIPHSIFLAQIITGHHISWLKQTKSPPRCFSPSGTSRALMYFWSPETWSSHRFLRLKFIHC